MVSCGDYQQMLGEALYAAIAPRSDVVDAGKVTGMLLHGLEDEALRGLLSSDTALDEMVGEAMAALRREALQELVARIKVFDDLATQTELPVPWALKGDAAISTGKVPVMKAVGIHAVLIQPLSQPFCACVELSQPANAPPVVIGTLSSTSCNAVSLALLPGEAKLTITLRVPTTPLASDGYAEAVDDTPVCPTSTHATADVATASAIRSSVQERTAPPAGVKRSTCWDDEEDDDDEELPSIADLRSKLNSKAELRRQGAVATEAMPSRTTLAAAMAGDAFESVHFDFGFWSSQPAGTVSAFILESLGEPNRIIGEATVEVLGVGASLYLLHCALSVQEQGGMAIPHEGGRMRTPGGVFVKLLRENDELDADLVTLAWRRIVKQGEQAKKHRNAMRRSQGKSGMARGKGLSPNGPFVSPTTRGAAGATRNTPRSLPRKHVSALPALGASPPSKFDTSAIMSENVDPAEQRARAVDDVLASEIMSES